MSKFIHRLAWKADANLEKSLGYPGYERWVAWHWEPELHQAFYTDGNQAGTAQPLAWQLFLDHPQIETDVDQYALTHTDEYWLLLDRKTRMLYVGDGKFVQGLLEQPESLGLLATFNSSKNPLQNTHYTLKNQWQKLTEWTAQKQWLKLIPIGISAGLMAAAGLGALSVLKTQHQLQSVTDSPPITPIITADSCGIGGSDDLSVFQSDYSSQRELHLIGIYEAHSNHRPGNHPTGIAQVNITRQNKPMILVLSAYEPVKWELKLAPGVQIEKIILNGYHDQQVAGVSGIPVEEYSYQDTGNHLGDFPYRSYSSALDHQLNQLTNTALTSFQGCYRGYNISNPIIKKILHSQNF